jgi:hypothetical protein
VIINSPVGRFPFEVTSFRRKGTTLVVEGRMGTWPTTVEVTAADIPAVARRARPAVGIVCAAALVGTLWAVLRRQ